MKSRIFILLFLIIDLLLINVAVFSLIGVNAGWEASFKWPPNELVIVFNVSWVLTYLIYINDLKYLKSPLWNLLKLTLQKMVVFFATASFCFIVMELDIAAYRFLFFGSSILFFLLKLLFSHLFKQASLQNPVVMPMLIIGDNKAGNQLFSYFEKNSHLGFRPLGTLDDEAGTNKNQHAIGRIADLQEICIRNSFHHVFISLPLSDSKRIKKLISICEKNGIRPHIVPNYNSELNQTFKVQELGNIPLLNIRRAPLDEYSNRFWKRAFDIAFGTILLLMLSPLFLLIAIAIKIDSKGPVFYRPIRLGFNGEPFILYKFRSMKDCDDANHGKKSTVLNDPRVTRLGRVLRKYNLDELPQLFNVLKNEMSIVGPRPHRLHLNKALQEKMSAYMIRHLVRPGITGWAQVNGWRGPTETRLQYKGRTLHDLWYLENWHFWLDIYIILLTAFGSKSRINAF